MAERGCSMKRNTILVMAAIAVCAIALMTFAASDADDQAAPIFGVRIPPGYRDWKLICVAREEGNFNDLRAQLGNDIAIKAFREGQLPFPDGTIIAAQHWHYLASEENNKVFGRNQSFIAGPVPNVQFMVKDSKKYAATGGWGFRDLKNSRPKDEAAHQPCSPCHEAPKARNYVF